jgi:hypothetical protein
MLWTRPGMVFLANLDLNGSATNLITRTSLRRCLGSAISISFWLCVAMGFVTAAQASAKSVQSATDVAAGTESPFALADFDGDKRLDVATVQVGQIGASDTQYWIHFRLSSGIRQLIPLTAPLGGLRIASQDVNGDSFVDLVVTTVWHDLPVAVLLNDGRGNFTVHDPRGFLAAPAAPYHSAVSAVTTRSDVAAALLSRTLSSSSDVIQRTASPADDGSLLFASVSQHKALALMQSVLGRAPPVFRI